MSHKGKSIGQYISILYRCGQSFFDKELQDYQIGSGQFLFLAVLLECDGISQESLAEKLQIDKGTTARALQKLEAAGYVTKAADPADKRANLVFVTAKARALCPVLLAITQKWTCLLTKNFSLAERELLQNMLKKMAENVMELND